MTHAQTARILFFTGTGGSALVARLCAGLLAQAGWKVETRSLADPAPATPADLEVYVFPVYAFSVPAPLAARVRRLPKADVPALVLACHGGGPLGAAERMASLLRRRGRQVVARLSLMTPAQWTQTGECPAPEAVLPLFRQVRDELTVWLPAVLARLPAAPGAAVPAVPLPPDPFGVSWAVRLPMGIVAFLYGRLGRHFLGLVYAAEAGCNSCGLCARECTGSCIKMVPARTPGRSRPRWGLGCTGCNRCINRCPVQAIQCTWLRLWGFLGPQLAGLTVLVWAWAAHGWLGLAAGAGGLAVLTLLQLALLPGLFSRLEDHPATRDFALAGWTRRYPRYLAPKELAD